MQYFPLPNTTGLADGRQNYVINAVDSDGYDNELGRLDISPSDKHKISFDVRHNFRAQNKNNFFNNAATGNFLKAGDRIEAEVDESWGASVPVLHPCAGGARVEEDVDEHLARVFSEKLDVDFLPG